MKVTPRVMGRHSILEKCYKTRTAFFFFFFSFVLGTINTLIKNKKTTHSRAWYSKEKLILIADFHMLRHLG